ncbi:MAG: hypothetical protein J5823_03270 [Paludibacteraceae bacterium]|nr:hypothetical protein [Paludibacteraceae bacterium]
MLCLILTGLLCACTWGDYYMANFDDLVPSFDSTMFRVTSRRVTDLSAGIPADCYMPDGTLLSEWQDDEPQSDRRRTSAVTGAGMIQSILDRVNGRSVVEISGIYESMAADGSPITLSGKVLMPADGKFDRYIVVSHYTIGSNKEAPSNAFPLEGMLCSMGYALICPDYIGYGITADKIHPYLVMDVTAINVVDMYVAVRKYFDAAGLHPKHDDIYLMGYSQGGATTMAVEYMIEEIYNLFVLDEPIKIRRVFAGGGPYDVKATYERFVTENVADYPVAVPLVLQGMIKGNDLDLDLKTMMQPWLCDKLDDWINSKLYTTAEINELLGTKITSYMLTETGMNVQSKEVSELFKAMVQNSIISYAWEPQAPVYIMHSMDDETVTYLNATNAKQRWANANIIYNFGHYGGHIKTCLRFILTVKTLLEQDRKEENTHYVN